MNSMLREALPTIPTKWNAWRRWWRMPERGLARKQIRRGLLFWMRWPWWAMLIAYVAMNLASPLISNALYAQIGKLGSAGYAWLLQSILLLPQIVLLISWATCLQDESLRFFEGKRLQEILLTPSSPKRFFPALLFAPITAFCLARAITSALGFAITFYNLWHQPWPQVGIVEPAWYNTGFTRAILWHLHIVAIVWASSLFSFCGPVSLAAAWSIGHARSIAMMRTFLIATIYYFGVAMLILIPQLLFGYLGMLFCYFSWALTSAIGIVCWRVGLNRLRGPKMIARLHRAAESAR